MITVLFNYANRSTCWYKSYINFKHIILGERVGLKVNFFRLEGQKHMFQLLVQNLVTIIFQIYCRVHKIWNMESFDFLGMRVPPFYCSSAVSITH